MILSLLARGEVYSQVDNDHGARYGGWVQKFISTHQKIVTMDDRILLGGVGFGGGARRSC